MGGVPPLPGSVPGASIQKLINIDRSKTGRNFGINLKEVNKGNNKITELQTILQRESQNS